MSTTGKNQFVDEGGRVVATWGEAFLLEPAGDLDGLRRALRSSGGYDVLDDAVMGSLLDSTVMELLEEFGIAWTAAARRWFARELDVAIGEGC